VPAACKGEWKLEKADIRKIVAAGDTVKLDYDTIKFATLPFCAFPKITFGNKDCLFDAGIYTTSPYETDFSETGKMKFGFTGHAGMIEFRYEIKRSNRLILTRLFDMYDSNIRETYPVLIVLTYRKL
jgi:hypothetical protein